MTTDSILRNQTVLVVGGGSGIGAAVAREAMRRGAQVVVAGRHLERLERIGVGAHAVVLDVTDEAGMQAALARIGHIDHLVVTAAAAVGSPRIAEADLATARAAFDVKFWGTLRLVQLVLPHLAETGSITLTTGVLARKFVPGGFIRSTLNAALEAFVKNLAKEIAPRRANAVSPGVTATEAYASMSAAEREAMFQRTARVLPAGRVGTATDLAQAYVLAMENEFMTGIVIDVEGGALL
ncbi:MAG: SDR family oxidoreductase [Candidatus Dactylopiibacterium sp.]|nr:SDR family oxidoreductase [Candidatus Dactylopiibacterium sp.]